jgi:hypothetical protein
MRWDGILMGEPFSAFPFPRACPYYPLSHLPVVLDDCCRAARPRFLAPAPHCGRNTPPGMVGHVRSCRRARTKVSWFVAQFGVASEIALPRTGELLEVMPGSTYQTKSVLCCYKL